MTDDEYDSLPPVSPRLRRLVSWMAFAVVVALCLIAAAVLATH